MDSAFLLPGINRRVGLDAVIGLVPVLGDIAGMAIASYIVYEAKRLGAPRWLVWRMMANVDNSAEQNKAIVQFGKDVRRLSDPVQKEKELRRAPPHR